MSDDTLRDAYQQRLRSAMPADRSACPTPDALQALADQSLPHGGRVALLDHVLGCAHCAPEFALLRAVATASAQPSAAGTSSPVAAPSPWLSPARVAIAATLVVALGIGSVTWPRVRNSEPVLRDDSAAVTLVAPRGAVDSDAMRTFTWRRVDGADGYLLEVLDTAGTLLVSRTSTDTTVTLDADAFARIEGRGSVDWMVAARRTDGNERRSSLTRVRLKP